MNTARSGRTYVEYISTYVEYICTYVFADVTLASRSFFLASRSRLAPVTLIFGRVSVDSRIDLAAKNGIIFLYVDISQSVRM